MRDEKQETTQTKKKLELFLNGMMSKKTFHQCLENLYLKGYLHGLDRAGEIFKDKKPKKKGVTYAN